MGHGIKDKNCIICGKLMVGVNSSKIRCEECKEKLAKIAYEDRKQKRKTDNKLIRDKNLSDNFFIVTQENGFTLTSIGFNEVSKYNVQSYTNHFKTNWFNVLKMYEKDKKLIDYINSEFVISECKTLKQLIISHKYINKPLIDMIGGKNISKFTDISVFRYTKEDLSNNFINIKNRLKRVPLYIEFRNMSKITIHTYVKQFNLPNQKYENIVKLFVTEEEFQQYKKYRLKTKSSIGKVTGGLSRKHTDEDLEKEFKHVFDFFKNEFGIYPGQKMFKKLSLIDESTYRGRFNKSFTEIAKMYGYEIKTKQFKCEKITLDLIAKILNTTYKSQKTWDWLIGAGDAHMFCDGYYADYNLVVEFDGEQHSRPVKDFGGEKSFKRLQENDELKNKLLPEHGIKIIRINYDEPFYDKEYLKQVLINNNIIKN